MKFSLSLVGLSLTGAALARPKLESRDDVQTVHLTFHGGPASYDLSFAADGTKHDTSMFQVTQAKGWVGY